MKKSRVWFLVLLVALILASCATAPEDSGDVVIAEPEVSKVEEIPVPEDVSVDEAKAVAEDARESAIAAKAPKAAAAEFNSAEALFEQAADTEGKGNNAEAIKLYYEAANGFVTAQNAAVQAREDARAAMDAADRDIADSKQAADEARRAAEEDE